MKDQDWNAPNDEPQNEDEYYDEMYDLEARMPLTQEEFEALHLREIELIALSAPDEYPAGFAQHIACENFGVN